MDRRTSDKGKSVSDRGKRASDKERTASDAKEIGVVRGSKLQRPRVMFVSRRAKRT